MAKSYREKKISDFCEPGSVLEKYFEEQMDDPTYEDILSKSGNSKIDSSFFLQGGPGYKFESGFSLVLLHKRNFSIDGDFNNISHTNYLDIRYQFFQTELYTHDLALGLGIYDMSASVQNALEEQKKKLNIDDSSKESRRMSKKFRKLAENFVSPGPFVQFSLTSRYTVDSGLTLLSKFGVTRTYVTNKIADKWEEFHNGFFGTIGLMCKF